MEVEMWWIWAFLAAVFILGEYIRNGSFMLWLGFGAAVSCVLSLLDTPAAGQIAVFVNLSGILILLERRFKERYRFKTPEEMNAGSPEISVIQPDQCVFLKTGAVWAVEFCGDCFTVKHSIGLLHIKNLLVNPNQWISCTELKNISSRILENGAGQYKNMSKEQLGLENLFSSDSSSAEDVIDKLSMEKIKDLRDLIYEKIAAEDFSDPEDLIQNKNKLEFIDDYLNKNTDNRGKSRKVSGRAEADRKAVSAAINRSRNNLKDHNELYTHFKSFIQAKGNSFRYLPDRQIYLKTE